MRVNLNIVLSQRTHASALQIGEHVLGESEENFACVKAIFGLFGVGCASSLGKTNPKDLEKGRMAIT